MGRQVDPEVVPVVKLGDLSGRDIESGEETAGWAVVGEEAGPCGEACALDTLGGAGVGVEPTGAAQPNVGWRARGWARCGRRAKMGFSRKKSVMSPAPRRAM